MPSRRGERGQRRGASQVEYSPEAIRSPWFDQPVVRWQWVYPQRRLPPTNAGQWTYRRHVARALPVALAARAHVLAGSRSSLRGPQSPGRLPHSLPTARRRLLYVHLCCASSRPLSSTLPLESGYPGDAHLHSICPRLGAKAGGPAAVPDPRFFAGYFALRATRRRAPRRSLRPK